jgi:hypothetical protein
MQDLAASMQSILGPAAADGPAYERHDLRMSPTFKAAGDQRLRLNVIPRGEANVLAWLAARGIRTIEIRPLVEH